ncbi:MAG: efflux RND transporter periplasmic adaptor subunit [Acidobacteria bacterium]|nr:efflux RND transporter periplasmic adaptor subunit [Acidobacteriota bacterium]
MRIWKFVIPAAGALLMTGCAKHEPTANAAGNPAPPAVTVKVATAAVRSMPVEIKTIGKVEAFASVQLKAVIGGTITKAFFTEGDSVKKGDLLFEVDSRAYVEAIRQWEANLARDQALQKQSEAQLASAQAQEAFYGMQEKRYADLAKQGIVSQEQADQAGVEARARRTNVRAVQAAIDSIKATIRADEAAIENAKLNLSYCSVRAPINGRTGDMRIKPGNVIKANETELVTIHQVQPAYVAFTVPEAKLITLRRRMKQGGLTVSATIPDDTLPDSKGTITFMDNSVDPATGTIRLKATFPNAETRLWTGQFVNVRVLLEEKANSVVVPAAALQNSQAGNYVYVVTAAQTVEMRPVVIGTRADREIAIDKGLQGGEKVVVEGQLRLSPGMKVKAL